MTIDAGLIALGLIAVGAIVRIWIERRRERIEWLQKHYRRDYA